MTFVPLFKKAKLCVESLSVDVTADGLRAVEEIVVLSNANIRYL
jgi:hypothetical protein